MRRACSAPITDRLGIAVHPRTVHSLTGVLILIQNEIYQILYRNRCLEIVIDNQPIVKLTRILQFYTYKILCIFWKKVLPH